MKKEKTNSSRCSNKPIRAGLSIIKKIIFIIFSLILLAGQLFLIYLLFFKASHILWIYIIVKIIGFICVIAIFDKKMVGSYKLLWTIMILVVPFVGTILFLLYGDERSFPTHKSRKIHRVIDKYIPVNNYSTLIRKFDPVAFKHITIVNKSTHLPFYTNTNVTFYSNIEEKVNKLLDDMKNAKRYIFIEFFIISSGKMLDDFIDVLTQKGNEGVEIKICYDAFGSKSGLKKKDVRRLKEIPNLTLVKFAPFGLSINIAVNYRDHRKIVIIDGNIAYMGGDNLADEYANYKTRFGYWRDNAVRLEGEAVENCLYLFVETWYLSTKKIIDIEKYKGNASIPNTMNVVMPFGDGPTDSNNPACDLYNSITDNAKKYLYISTPYFVIDREFINHLSAAARSGIDVRLLIPGIPDKKAVYVLSQSHFGDLLKSGVKIYRYKPGFNHAKNYICDDNYAVIGSINVDYRSLYLHFESGVYLANERVILQMKQNFLEDLEKSEEFKLEDYKKRNIFVRAIAFIMKIFSPLM